MTLPLEAQNLLVRLLYRVLTLLGLLSDPDMLCAPTGPVRFPLVTGYQFQQIGYRAFQVRLA